MSGSHAAFQTARSLLRIRDCGSRADMRMVHAGDARRAHHDRRCAVRRRGLVDPGWPCRDLAGGRRWPVRAPGGPAGRRRGPVLLRLRLAPHDRGRRLSLRRPSSRALSPGPAGSMQAPHIMVSVMGRGILTRFITRLYFEDEAANDQDAILAAVPAARRDTLIARRIAAKAATSSTSGFRGRARRSSSMSERARSLRPLFGDAEIAAPPLGSRAAAGDAGRRGGPRRRRSSSSASLPRSCGDADPRRRPRRVCTTSRRSPPRRPTQATWPSRSCGT